VTKEMCFGCHPGWVNKRTGWDSVYRNVAAKNINSLITIMFCFNEFAFTVQVKHKISSTQILGFILMCLYFTTGYSISTRVYLAQNVVYFPSNFWLSFKRLCRLLWGYHFHFVDSNHVPNNSGIFVPSWHVCLFWCPRRRRPPRCIKRQR